jgi:putative peptidoglycan lipid II flippase
VPFNLVMIGAALGFGRRLGVRVLAVAFIVGSGLRLLLQVPTVRRLGMRSRPSLALRDAGFREMAHLLPPLLVGSALGNVDILVDRAVGSLLGPGAISALNYGFRLVQLPYTLLAVTLGTALYPALGVAARPGNRAELRRLVRRGVSMLVVLMAPAVALLVVAGEPMVVVVFGRGDFDPQDVAATTAEMAGFAAGLFGMACREVASRACYALGDARGPVLTSVAGVLVNIAGDLLLGRWYGVAGVAAATALSLCVAAALLLWRLRRKHDALVPRALVPVAVAGVAAAAVAGAAGWLMLQGLRRLLTAGATEPGTGVAAVEAVLTGVVVLGVYLLLLRLARRPEPVEIARLLGGALARARGRGDTRGSGRGRHRAASRGRAGDGSDRSGR